MIRLNLVYLNILLYFLFFKILASISDNIPIISLLFLLFYNMYKYSVNTFYVTLKRFRESVLLCKRNSINIFLLLSILPLRYHFFSIFCSTQIAEKASTSCAGFLFNAYMLCLHLCWVLLISTCQTWHNCETKRCVITHYVGFFSFLLQPIEI